MTDPKPHEVSLNYVSKNRATLNIPGLNDLTLTLKSFPLPGISLPPVEVPSPFYQKKFAGDKVMFDTLNLVFIVDERLTNWIEVWKWIVGLGAPEDKEQYREKEHNELDAYMTIYSSHNNPLLKVKFLECIPTALSELPFSEDITETEIIEATVSIEYLRYEFVPL